MSPVKLIAPLCLFLLALAQSAQAQNLVANGDFEAGLADWTTWSAPPSTFWDDVWIHSNDCDIWVPTNGCPFAGAISHAQKKGSGSGNAHGGLTQVLSVTPGQTYAVSGVWSGGVAGNVAGNNGTWWEIVIYDGTPTDAEIDSGIGAADTLIAKREINNLGNNEVFQFQWEPFNRTFVAPSDTVTLVLKTGSFFTFAAAGYHDNLSVEAVPVAPVPVTPIWALLLLAMALVGVALLRQRRLESTASRR